MILRATKGWVSVGIDHDTAAFATRGHSPLVEEDGPKASYTPARRSCLITADGGGSNGSRCRLWKVALARLADETGMTNSGLSFPARDEQVEQDRAPDVLPHHPELAGSSSDESVPSW